MTHANMITHAQRSALGLKIANAGLARYRDIEASGPHAQYLYMLRHQPFDPARSAAVLKHLDLHQIVTILNNPVVPVGSAADTILNCAFDAHKPKLPIEVLSKLEPSLSAAIWDNALIISKERGEALLSRMNHFEREAMRNIFSDHCLSSLSLIKISRKLGIVGHPTQSPPMYFRISVALNDASTERSGAVKMARMLDFHFAKLFVQCLKENDFVSLSHFFNSFYPDTLCEWARFFSRNDMPADACAGIIEQSMPITSATKLISPVIFRRLLQHPDMHAEKAGAILAEMDDQAAASILIGLADYAIACFKAVADKE